MALEERARLLPSRPRLTGTERAIQTAVRLLALDPLQEAVHRTLMRSMPAIPDLMGFAPASPLVKGEGSCPPAVELG